jgi:hypothetical protein
MPTTIKQTIALDGADAIRKQFTDLGRSGETAFRQIRETANGIGFDQVQQATQSLARDLQNLGSEGAKAGSDIASGMKEAEDSIGKVGIADVLGNIASTTARVVATIGGIAVAVSGALSAMAKAGATAATEIDTNAKKLGITTEAYQKLIIAAGQAGVSQKDAADGFSKLSSELDKHKAAVEEITKKYDPFHTGIRVLAAGVDRAGEEIKKVAGPFAELGVQLVDSKGKFLDTDKVVEALAKKLTSLGEGTAQDTLADKFGVKELLPLLNEGVNGLNKFKQAAVETGRIMTPEQIGVGKKLDDAIDLLKNSFANLGSALVATRNQIGIALAPGNTKTTEFFTGIIDSITAVIDANRPLTVELAKTAIGFSDIVKTNVSQWFEDSGGAAGILSSVILGLTGFAKDLYSVFSNLVRPALVAIGAGFKLFTDAINSFFGTNVSTQFVVIATAIGVLSGAFSIARGAIGAIIGVFGSLVGAILAFPAMFIAAGAASTLFWTELRAGGVAAFAAIRPLLPAFGNAFRLLFQGNFAAAWEQFAVAGELAWLRIRAATVEAKGPVGDFFKTLSNAFRFVMALLDGLAGAINTVFGTKLTGSTLGLYLVLAQLAGVFTILGPGVIALTTCSLAAWICCCCSGRFHCYSSSLFPDLSASWQAVTAAFSNFVQGNFQGAIDNLSKAFSGFWQNLQKEGVATWIVLGIGAASFVRLLSGILSPLTIITGAFLLAGILIIRNFEQINESIIQIFSGDWAGAIQPFVDSVRNGGDAVWALLVAGALAAVLAIRLAFAGLGAFIAGGPIVWAAGGAVRLVQDSSYGFIYARFVRSARSPRYALGRSCTDGANKLYSIL